MEKELLDPTPDTTFANPNITGCGFTLFFNSAFNDLANELSLDPVRAMTAMAMSVSPSMSLSKVQQVAGVAYKNAKDLMDAKARFRQAFTK